MKILHVADLHINHVWFDWVANQRDFDLLVVAGDLQDGFSDIPMEEQARAIQDWLLAIRLPVAVCSGNHDFWSTPDDGSGDPMAEAGWLKSLKGKGNIVAVDGDVLDFAGNTILVNGWGQVPTAEMPLDIVVTHAPPAGSPCAQSVYSYMDCGDPVLVSSLEPFLPRVMLCGHVHRPKLNSCEWPVIGRLTTVLVPGQDETSEVPNHWIIDMEAGTTQWNGK